MKYLITSILLILVVAEAHHTHEHTLRGPRFSVGKVHIYDVEFNVTSGIRGLSSQVSKLAFKAELQVHAKSAKEHLLKIVKVYTSGSVKATEHKDAVVQMERDRDLEAKLSTPIKFNMENGKIISYTLSPNESLESKKIKKAILRRLEMQVPEAALQQMESRNSGLRVPVTYNTTKNLGASLHTTHYMITVSPNVEFPYESNVYNISRSENFEDERYHSHKFHHNFRQQGCADVCRTEGSSNKYDVGCPAGFEPHQSPMKMYVLHQHHMVLEDGVMTPEIIKTTEIHTANMYDQDMEVLIRHHIRKIGHTNKVIEEPSSQTTYTNLDDQEIEIDEEGISAKCEQKSPREITETAKRLLKEMASTIVRGNLESKESTVVGEKIILLKSALSKLTVADLNLVAADIVKKGSLKTANEEERVKRQVWIDILPLIGTSESVTFIVNYIKDIERELFVWEAKEILEALPQNIHSPSEKIIRELRTLLSLPKSRGHLLLLSATHSCVARVISSMCRSTEPVSSKRVMKSPWSRNQEQSMFYNPPECPAGLVSEILKEISDKLKNSKKQDEIIIYVENLIRTGVKEALPIVIEYIYGTAENIQQFSPSYIDFVKSTALYSLHSIASKHPEEVLSIVKPMFFNDTEVHKIRTAAFGVLIRCQPSLEILQHVAVRSWTEKSNEVGSFVTSTLDSFGNSSLPCMHLTAYRIRQVMPMIRRFDIGLQHAKNKIWSYFDDVHMLGLKGRLSYIPSNASIIPSAFYQSLSYSTDSLTDSIFSMAMNIEGLTQRKLFEYIDKHILGLDSDETISSSKEKEIFGKEDGVIICQIEDEATYTMKKLYTAKLVERIPDTLRFTLYKRMFYSSSFYHLDLDNIKPQIDTLKEYLKAYLKRTDFDYSGHLVKLFLPSYFHTVTMAKTLPYPVEFEMHQPIVLALKVESKERNPSINKFHLHVRPSVYLTRLFTNQLKNIGDCKEIGVYHEHKMAISYPIEVKFQADDLKNISVSYKLPEMPKKVMYYFTEAGTYAGKKTLVTLPSSEDREPIRTLPSPFENSGTIHLVGVPPIHVESHTEEIGGILYNLPNTPFEVVHFAVKTVLNAGWRYKAANFTIKDDSKAWHKDTEVIFNIHYNRSHAMRKNLRMTREQKSPNWPEDEIPENEWIATEFPASDEDSWNTESPQLKWSWRNSEDEEDNWSQDLKADDVFKNRNPSAFIEQARKVSSRLSSMIPHINHLFHVQMETRPVHSKAYVRFEYNHTYTKSLHSVHVDAGIKAQDEREFRTLSIDHLMGYSRKPDIFSYDTHKDDHKALFITGIRKHPMDCSCPWKNVEAVVKGVFSYEPLDHLLNSKLHKSVERKYFLSEQHDECLEDIKNGHPLSVNCIRAMRERFIYNKLRIAILWNRNLPQSIKNWSRRVDNYIKYKIFNNRMSIGYKTNTPNRIHISLDHIHKLTDEPVFDVIIVKPHETITLRKMRAVDEPLSSIHDMVGIELMERTNNTYPPTCVMMQKYLKTYDQLSYPLSLDQCNYVLSAHCSDHKNFAILAKILSTDGTKEIHMHVGQHTLVLSPLSGNHYNVKYDGQDYTISEPTVFDEDSANIYVYPERYSSGNKYLEVVAQQAGIKLMYHAKNVQVEIHPRYKGETCGLCSEFDGEIIREFRGMDKCLYSHPVDFVNSAITNQECRKQPLHPHICEENTDMIRLRSHDDYVPSIKRNVVVPKSNEICFSVLPVPVCENAATPSITESIRVGFHCLPKQDITARRMVSESQRRILGEIENKSVDYEADVEIAKMC